MVVVTGGRGLPSRGLSESRVLRRVRSTRTGPSHRPPVLPVLSPESDQGG